MRLLFITYLLLALPTLLAAQDTTWQRGYGSDQYDQARSVIETPDSGFLIVGSTSSWGNGNSDAYILKINRDGDLEWTKTYGGDQIDWAVDVGLTLDSGYAVVGYSNSFGDLDYDVYLMRLDSEGNLLWDSTYGGPDWDFGHSIEAVDDGGFVIAGEAYGDSTNGNSDGYLLKVDEFGAVEWQQWYGGPGEDNFLGSDTVSTGGLVFVGKTSPNPGTTDLYILRTDRFGNEIWSTTYGGTAEDFGTDIVEMLDGNFAVSGGREVTPGDLNAWSFKQSFNNTGMIWEQVESGTGIDYTNSIAEANLLGSRVSMGATTFSFGFAGTGDFFNTIRTGQSGTFVAAGTFGFPGFDECYKIISTSDNGFLMVGNTDGEIANFGGIYAIKTDFTGNVEGAFINIEDINSIAEYALGNAALSYYPNPTSDFLHLDFDVTKVTIPKQLTVHIRDISGRIVLQEVLQGPQNKIALNALQSAGFYTFEVVGDGTTFAAGKFIHTIHR